MPTALQIPFAAKLFPFAAGVITAVGSTLLTVDFWRAMIITIVSAVLTALGTIIGGWVAVRHTKQAIEPLENDVLHVRRAMGIDRRTDDTSSETRR